MTIEEIKSYLKTNKDNEDVKAFVETINPITKDRIELFVRSDKDTKSWFDSEKDKHLTKGIETFKTNNLQKLVDEKVKELYPDEDPKDTELKKMKAEIEKMKAEKLRESLTNKALKVANEKKLPTDLIDFFVGSDEETTNKNIEKLEGIFNSHITTQVEEKLKSGYKPPKNDGTGNSLTKEDFKKMSYSERVKLSTENPDLYKELSK